MKPETCQKGQDFKKTKNIALWKNLLSGSYITDKMSASFKQKTAEFTKNINISKLAHASLKDWHPTNFCHYYFYYYYYQNYLLKKEENNKRSGIQCCVLRCYTFKALIKGNQTLFLLCIFEIHFHTLVCLPSVNSVLYEHRKIRVMCLSLNFIDKKWKNSVWIFMSFKFICLKFSLCQIKIKYKPD